MLINRFEDESEVLRFVYYKNNKWPPNIEDKF